MASVLQNYKNATSEKEKEQWSNQFRWELARHSIGEEIVLYPAFEKHLGAQGKELADHDRAAHATVSPVARDPIAHLLTVYPQIKQELSELQSINVSDARHEERLNRLWRDLDAHIKE